ncbi:MAG: carboxypeptidase-like regulatory domain-containing protein [Pseudomonadota bacterium]
MTRQRLLALLTCALLALGLSACGGGSTGGGGTGGGNTGGDTGGGGAGGDTGGSDTGGDDAGDDTGGGDTGDDSVAQTVTVSGVVTDAPIANAIVTLTVDGQQFEAPTPTDANGAYTVEISSTDPDALVLCEAVDPNGAARFTALLDDFEGFQEAANEEGVVEAVDITNVTTAQFVLATQLTDDGQIDDLDELETAAEMVDADELLELSAAIKVVVEAIEGVTLPEGIDDTQALAEAIAEGTTTFVEDLEVTNPGTLDEAVDLVLTDGNATVAWTEETVPGVYMPSDDDSVFVFFAGGQGLRQDFGFDDDGELDDDFERDGNDAPEVCLPPPDGAAPPPVEEDDGVDEDALDDGTGDGFDDSVENDDGSGVGEDGVAQDDAGVAPGEDPTGGSDTGEEQFCEGFEDDRDVGDRDDYDDYYDAVPAEDFTWSINEAGQLRIDFTEADGTVEFELVTLIAVSGDVVKVSVERSGDDEPSGEAEEEDGPQTDSAVFLRFADMGFDTATVPGTYTIFEVEFEDDEAEENAFEDDHEEALVFLGDGNGYELDLESGFQDGGFTWRVDDSGVLNLAEADGENATMTLLDRTSTGLLTVLVVATELEDDGTSFREIFVETLQYSEEIAEGPQPDAANTAALAGKTYAQVDDQEIGLFTFGADGTFTEIFERREIGGYDFGEDEGQWIIDGQGVLSVNFEDDDDDVANVLVVAGLGEDQMTLLVEPDEQRSIVVDRVTSFDEENLLGLWIEQTLAGEETAMIQFEGGGFGVYDIQGENPTEFEWAVDDEGTLHVFPIAGPEDPEGILTVTFYKLASSDENILRVVQVFRVDGELDPQLSGGPDEEDEAFADEQAPNVLVSVTLSRLP